MGMIISCKKIGEVLLPEDLETELDLEGGKNFERMVRTVGAKEKTCVKPHTFLLLLFLSEASKGEVTAQSLRERSWGNTRTALECSTKKKH